MTVQIQSPLTRTQQNARKWARSAGKVWHPDDWAPQPAQERFLRLGCFEALYGGAAGGGKSDALLVWAAAPIGLGHGKAYQALLLRRTFPELEKSLIRRAEELYPRLGGVPKNEGAQWNFPGGERILLEHCEHEKSVTRYQGAPFVRVGFDELTTFTEYQYLYLFSRIRSAAGIACGIRASSNPGGIGHEWVRKRFLPWVSRTSKKPASPGAVRYYIQQGDNEVEVPRGTPHALGRTFIPAKLEDNPALMEQDPAYESRLRALPRIDRERLRGGDWDAEPGAKDYWDRKLVGVLRHMPRLEDVIGRCRAWDFGATKKGDPTAGVRLSRLRTGRWPIEHVAHLRGGPDEVHKCFTDTAEEDQDFDPGCVQIVPQDPGAAGIFFLNELFRRNPKIAIVAVRPTGDKPTRFRAAASRALEGFFDVVDDGSWDVDAFHAEAEAFPDGSNDDRIDGTADAYNHLALIDDTEDEAPITFK